MFRTAFSIVQGGALALAILVAFAGPASAQKPRVVWSAQAHSGAVNAVAFSPDGRWLATAGADHAVKLWRARDGAYLRTLEVYYDEASSVAFSADGALLASGSLDETARLTDVASGITSCTQTTTGFVRDVAMRPDGTTLALALGYSSNDLDLVDVASCQLAAILKPHWGTVWSVAYSANGAWLASGGADGNTVVYSASGQAALTLGLHQNDVSGVALTADGTKVASCGESDHRVLVWDLPSGNLLFDLPTPGEFLHGVDVSRNGQRIASCGEVWPSHGAIHVWRLADGAPLASYDQNLGPNVPSLAFAPNGETFVYGRSDGVLARAVAVK